MNYKVVILDLDNTLIDFDYMEKCSLKNCLQAFDLPYDDETMDTYIKINQVLWEGLELGHYKKSEILTLRFEQFLNKFDFKGDPVAMNKTYLSGMANYIQMIEGAKTVLDFVKNKFVTVMITNGVTVAQNAKLDQAHLRPYFDHIIISDEVGAHKPTTEIFDHMTRLIGGYDKSDIIIVGDSLTSDIQGGINYGIDTCWYNPNEKTSDKKITYTIKHLNELLQIL